MPTPLDSSQYELASPGQELKPLDSGSIEQLPSYANGASELTPINTSPVGLEDRVKLSMGNTAGKISYLKQNFEDAKMNPQGDLVVKNQGIWHRVSPDVLGEPDAWETTKKIANTLIPPVMRMALEMGGKKVDAISGRDIMGKLADASGGAIPAVGGVVGGAMAGGTAAAEGIMGGAAAGAMFGGVPGAVAGAIGGGIANGAAGSVAGAGAGGAAGEAIRTSLGRLAGTYTATPEEQLRDIGWEGLLNSGGQAVALGAKPTLGMMKMALEPYAQSATNVAKDIMSSIWGHATGAGDWAVRRAMDDPEPVMAKVESALSTIGRTTSAAEAPGVAKDAQIGIVRSLAKDSKAALQAQYRADSARFVGEVGDNFSADLGGLVQKVQQNMADAGYGKLVSSRSAGRPIAAIGEDIAEKEAGPKVFRLLTPTEMAQNLGTTQGQLGKVMGEDTMAAMQKLTKLTNEFAQAPVVKGKAGALKLVEFKKAVGETFNDMLAGRDLPPSVARAVQTVKQDFEDQIGQSFMNHSDSAYNAFAHMNERYAAGADAVNLLNDAVRQGTEENLIPQLVSKSGSNRMLKGELKTAAGLLGPAGNARIQALLDWEAAKGFMKFTPRTLEGGSLTSLVRGAGMVTGQTSPRVVNAQIAYGHKALDFLQGLGKEGARQFLSNDKAVQMFATQLLGGVMGEDAKTEDLLRQAGVK